jgi:uncharacterized protein involved in type VI secretion and phage assembly
VSESELLRTLLAPGDEPGRFFGVTVGIVTNVQDPERLGRVKLRFPWLSDQNESNWARVAVAMAGFKYGVYFIPDVGDEVLCAFEQGVIDYPYVVGALWNGKDKPPVTDSDGKNNIRTIRSRSGHVLTFDDSAESPKVVLADNSGVSRITIDTKTNAVSIESKGDIVLSAGGKIRMTGVGVEIDGKTGPVKIGGKGAVGVEAGGTLDVKGKLVRIN